MSNTEGAPDETPVQPYKSNVDPLFSQAWNEVYNPETPAEADPAPEAPEAGGTEEVPAAPVVGQGGEEPAAPTGSEPAEPGAPATGAENLGELPGSQETGGAGEPGPAEANAQPASPAPTGAPSNSGATRTYAEVAPLLDAAAAGINERAEQGFRTKAIAEIREEIAPQYLERLEQHPRLLIGAEVPKVQGEGTEILADEADARSWQEAVKQVITQQVNQRTNAMLEDAKPSLSIVQDSLELFRRNRDLVPGTAEYNPALADQFVALTKSYQAEVNGKVVGWRVEVQPLLDHLRASLATAPATPTPRQEQVANQPRNEAGQFEAPQTGITSKSGLTGDGGGENYDAFWAATGLQMPL